MTNAQYTGLVNLTTVVMMAFALWVVGSWIWRERRIILLTDIGMLLVIMFFSLIVLGYEAGYYGVARFAHKPGGVNMWNEEPWSTVTAWTRSAVPALVALIYAAKLRADGRHGRALWGRAGVFALFGLCVFVAFYYALIV